MTEQMQRPWVLEPLPELKPVRRGPEPSELVPLLARQRPLLKLPPLSEPARVPGPLGRPRDLDNGAPQSSGARAQPVPVAQILGGERGGGVPDALPDLDRERTATHPFAQEWEADAHCGCHHSAFAAVELDLTRLVAAEGDESGLRDAISRVVVASVSALKATTLASARTKAGPAIDVLLVHPGSAPRVLEDADRMSLNNVRIALDAVETLPEAAAGGVRADGDVLRVSLTCSGADRLLYANTHPASDVTVALDLGVPIRRPVVRRDATGAEALVFRSIAVLTARVVAPFDASELSRLLNRIRRLIEDPAFAAV